MGNSRSASTVRKVLDYLTPLLKRETIFYPCPSSTQAAKLAYKLREARTIVRKRAGEFPQLAEVLDSFTFAVQEDGVKAEWKPTLETLPAETGRFSSGVSATPRSASIVLVSPSFDQVVQAFIDHAPNPPMIVCQEVTFSNEELGVLAKWAATQGWMVLHVSGQTQVTLAPDDPDVPAEAKIQV